MAKETEIDLNNSDDSEFTFDEEPEDTIKEAGEESSDPSEKDHSMETKEQHETETEQLFAGFDDQTEDSQAELSEGSNVNDFVGLDDDDDDDDDEKEDQPAEAVNPKSEVIPKKNPADNKPEQTTAEKSKNTVTQQAKSPKKEVAKKTAKGTAAQKTANRPSSVNKIISFALIVLIVTGFILYNNPSLVGLTKATQPGASPVSETVEPVTPGPQQVTVPSPPSKRDQCLAKLEEAVRLRNELLEKKEEIYELGLYYRNGIAELEEETYQEIKKNGLASYEAAMKNKRVELNMRTIQRRRAYIKELTKPAYWLNSGSEELLYLVRKAQLDLQLTEIAGGIDLNKHMRHISAAIQKYRPSPDKLAVDPLQSKVQPLEKIWQQVSNEKAKKEQISLNPKDDVIINQICAGNFTRIAELTSLSPAAARCLSRMKGSDLFLNGLTTLAPDAAKQLFQWPGNWIGLNGVQQLSPAAAQYLFKWKGNWISLNSLNEFPPELALYLLKWEGQQLELMGLDYTKNEANQKTLKYLALWETTGGKLFVTDKIRQEMESLM